MNDYLELFSEAESDNEKWAVCQRYENEVWVVNNNVMFASDQEDGVSFWNCECIYDGHRRRFVAETLPPSNLFGAPIMLRTPRTFQELVIYQCPLVYYNGN